MKKNIFLLIAFALGMSIEAQSSQAATRIIILATGGTIAGSGNYSTKGSYTAGKVPINELLGAVPQIYNYGKITGEQIASIGSQDMNVEIWLKLSNRINEIFKRDEADAVVITHGTDTMEETAYFLDLTIKYNKTVVLVGAMRASTAMSQDGNKNLLDAVMVAADPKSQSRGVLVAMDEKIFLARDVSKTSTTNIEAFQSNNFGPIGLIYDSKATYYYEFVKNNSEKFDISNLTSLPKVEIIYGYPDANPDSVYCISETGAEGLIYAGMGNGNFGAPIGKALIEASKKGITICRSSRVGSGRTTLGNEVNDAENGFIVSDDLNPQKSRVLLMLSLTQTSDRVKIQQNFFNY